MTKIVKSILVVDERLPDRGSLPLAEGFGSILKGNGQAAVGLPARMPAKDDYIDQLNRLRVDIRKAEEELRNIKIQTQEAIAGQAQHQEHAAQLWNLEAEASIMLERAKAQADEILNDARAEGVRMAEEARNEGYLDGFSRGYEEAGQEFRREYTPQVALIADVLDRLNEYEAQVLRDQEGQLVDLTLTIAEKVIGRALAENPATVAEMLREALEKSSGEQYVKITLSPDLAPIQANTTDEVRKLLGTMGATVTFMTGQGLPAGTALVETPKGVVDVSIQTQLNNLKDAALGR